MSSPPDPYGPGAATARYTAPMRTVPRRSVRQPDADRAPAQPLLRLELPLRLVTPMIGGGVVAREPDERQPVRVTAIRGALRWWWRAGQKDGNVKTLREAEKTLFGGVGAKGEEAGAQSSAVRIYVQKVDKLRLAPAGVHELKDGRLRTLPTWRMDRRLEYALFPLQRSEKERRAWQSGAGVGPMPTPPVVEELQFTLIIEVLRPITRPTKDSRHATGSEQSPPNREEKLNNALLDLLHAIHRWLWFGGVGGRTRRGFGALALVRPVTWTHKGQSFKLHERPSLPDGAAPSLPPGCPSLQGARLLLGPPEASAERAHATAVGLLKQFRQGEGFARDEGRAPGRPGRSRWPEPDLMKEVSGHGTFEHAQRGHSEDPATRKTGRALFAPRAGFGMPLIVQFKDDADARANGQIVPEPDETKETGTKKTDRWASPLILRPVPDGQHWRPAALILAGGAKPTRARVKSSKPLRTLPKDGDPVAVSPAGQPTAQLGGAREPVHGALRRGRQDAVDAFAAWLMDQGWQASRDGSKP